MVEKKNLSGYVCVCVCDNENIQCRTGPQKCAIVPGRSVERNCLRLIYIGLVSVCVAFSQKLTIP